MSKGAEVVAVDPGSPMVVDRPDDAASTWATIAEYGRRLIPVIIGALLIVSVMLLVSRIRFLTSFDTEFAGAGSFQVAQCDESGGDNGQWRCAGSLTVDGRLTEVPGRMVAARGSLTSSRPYVGEQIDIFFPTGDNSVVYPRSSRLGELTRLYIQLVPMLLLLFGSLLWLIGWAGKTYGRTPGTPGEMIVVEKGRQLQPSWAVRDLGFGPLRLASAGSLRRRGIVWLGAGFVIAVAVAILTRVLLGSLGLP